MKVSNKFCVLHDECSNDNNDMNVMKLNDKSFNIKCDLATDLDKSIVTTSPKDHVNASFLLGHDVTNRVPIANDNDLHSGKVHKKNHQKAKAWKAW